MTKTPTTKTVTRNGKSFQQTYWVSDGNGGAKRSGELPNPKPQTNIFRHKAEVYPTLHQIQLYADLDGYAANKDYFDGITKAMNGADIEDWADDYEGDSLTAFNKGFSRGEYLYNAYLDDFAVEPFTDKGFADGLYANLKTVNVPFSEGQLVKIYPGVRTIHGEENYEETASTVLKVSQPKVSFEDGVISVTPGKVETTSGRYWVTPDFLVDNERPLVVQPLPDEVERALQDAS